MNTLLVLLSWAGVQQWISTIMVLVIFLLGFGLYYILEIYPRQMQKIAASKEQLLPNSEIDAPKPLLVKVIRPDGSHPNRMIWNLPEDYTQDDLVVNLQKFLDSRSKRKNISIRVYSGITGVWINLVKKNEDSWEDIMLQGEAYLKFFFHKKIDFI